MSELVQGELPLDNTPSVDNSITTPSVPAPDPNEQKLSEREFKMAMARAYKERSNKIKQNKEMLDEMELEVRFYKAKRDLTVHRYESMEYYLKNLDIEPTYLAAVEREKAKEASAQVPSPAPSIVVQ